MTPSSPTPPRRARLQGSVGSLQDCKASCGTASEQNRGRRRWRHCSPRAAPRHLVSTRRAPPSSPPAPAPGARAGCLAPMPMPGPGCGVRRRPAPAADPPGCVGGVRRWRPRFPLTGSGCVFSAGFFERERRGFARRPAAATSPRFTTNVPVFTFKTQSNTSLHSNTSSAVAVFTASFHGFLSRRKEKARTWIVCWSAIQHALRVDLAPTFTDGPFRRAATFGGPGTATP